MTREEAIKELECYHREDGSVPDEITMAIEALNNSIQMSNIQQLEAENGFLKEMIKFYRNEDRPHGEWIEQTTDEMICSVCDAHWDYCDNDCARFNYCPNCGAYMGGKE